MSVLNFKFLFLTFPAQAPILRKEVHFKSLKSFRDLSWCGRLESMFYLHTELHHTFGTSLKNSSVDTPGSSSKPPSSSEKLSLGTPASSLSLSQTNSGQEPGSHTWCTHDRTADRNEYSARLITQLEQVVTQ